MYRYFNINLTFEEILCLNLIFMMLNVYVCILFRDIDNYHLLPNSTIFTQFFIKIRYY